MLEFKFKTDGIESFFLSKVYMFLMKINLLCLFQEFLRSQEPQDRSKYKTSYFNLLKVCGISLHCLGIVVNHWEGIQDASWWAVCSTLDKKTWLVKYSNSFVPKVTKCSPIAISDIKLCMYSYHFSKLKFDSVFCLILIYEFAAMLK